VLAAAPSEYLRCPSVRLLRVINKIKPLQELTVSESLCCRAEYAVPRGCRQAARGAGAWASTWGSGCSLWLHVLPEPTVAICDSAPSWGRVPLGVWGVLCIGKGTLITATGRGASNSHRQRTVADGAKFAAHSASPRRARGGGAPSAESTVPGSSLPPAQAELQSKASGSLLGQKWLALGSWSTEVTGDSPGSCKVLCSKLKGIDPVETNAQIVRACSFCPVLRGWKPE